MTIHCVDGEIADFELATWNVSLPPVRIALRCEQVRAVFVGRPLAKGIALLDLSRAQLEKLFPDRARRTNADNLMRFARRISGQEARRVLVQATWHQLRAAARYSEEEAQIQAALAWALGIRS